MTIKITIKNIFFLFGAMLSYTNTLLQGSKALSDEIHVGYSHAFGENAQKIKAIFKRKRVKSNDTGYRWQSCEESGGIMTFYDNKTMENYDLKEGEEALNDALFYISDKLERFGKSSAMRYAFLGHSLSMFDYPDAPGPSEDRPDLSKAVFYTKPAVHELANHLYDMVITHQKEKIILVGRSCGGGTAINLLEALVNVDRGYFNGSKITRRQDAEKILAAINNGAIILDVPLLSLKKSKVIIESALLLTCALLATPILGIYWYYKTLIFKSIASTIARLILVNTMGLSHLVAGGAIKNTCISSIIRYIVPRISKYDRFHQDPLTALEKIKQKMKCPILLHVSKYDGILESPDEDTIKMYECLKNNKTHIVVSVDGSHNERSDEFEHAVELFQRKYFRNVPHGKEERKMQWRQCDFSFTQPTVEELREKINRRGRGIFSYMMQKKYTLLMCVIAIIFTQMKIGS